MSGINWFDILIAVLLIVTLIKGYSSGLVMQIATLAGVVLGAIFAGILSEFIAPTLLEWTKAEPHIIAPLSYIIAFILIFIALILLGRSLQSIIKVVKMNIVNRILGAIFCSLTGLIALSILLNIVIEFDKDKRIINESVRTQSLAYPFVKMASPLIIPYLKFDWYNDVIERVIPK